jgi:tetratricopeptide (TPR) repeat protein
MSEKLQYDLRNDTDVQESTEMDSLSSKNKESLNSINELKKKVDEYQKSLSEKEEIIQKLTSQVDKSSHTLFDYYQKSLSVKDDTIHELSTQVDGQNKAAEEYHERLSEKEEVISEKDEALQQLTEQADRQKESAEEYQNILTEKEEAVSERDKIINQLASRIDNLNMFTKENQKSLSEKEEAIYQRTVRLDSQNVITLEQLTDEEETLSKVIPETDSSYVMVQVKSLYNEGKYDEAYRIAYDLKQKKPDFGLAYFVLGTIEIRKEHYDKGEELLNRAVQLGMPDDDMAWAFYNLGKSSLRKKDYKKARELLEKTIKLKPNMKESRKVLDLFNDLLDDVQEKKGNDKEEWGGNGR